MSYILFISIANMENVAFPVMNLTHYTLNIEEHIQNVVSNIQVHTIYLKQHGKWPVLKYFKMKVFILPHILYTDVQYILWSAQYIKYIGNLPLLFYAPPSLWNILTGLMVLVKDWRVIDSWWDPWSSQCSRLDDALTFVGQSGIATGSKLPQIELFFFVTLARNCPS